MADSLDKELQRANLALVMASLALICAIGLFWLGMDNRVRINKLTPKVEAEAMIAGVHRHIDAQGDQVDSLFRHYLADSLEIK